MSVRAVADEGGVHMILGIDPSDFAAACKPAVDAMKARATSSDEYRYASVPLCIIDAVFSLGVKYTQVENVVTNFCGWSGWSRVRPSGSLPSETEQAGMTVSDFLALRSRESDFANNVFRNHGRAFQRKYAPYKADVVFEFAEVLQRAGVETLQSAQAHAADMELDAALRALAGQSAGTAVSYFFMLTGSDDLVKPDRMLTRFTNAHLGKPLNRPLSASGLQELFRATAPLLGVTPRELDHAVWGRQSGRF